MGAKRVRAQSNRGNSSSRGRRNRPIRTPVRRARHLLRNMRQRWLRSSNPPFPTAPLSQEVLSEVLRSAHLPPRAPAFTLVPPRPPMLEISDDESDMDSPPPPEYESLPSVTSEDESGDEDEISIRPQAPSPANSMNELISCMDNTHVLFYTGQWNVDLQRFRRLWGSADPNVHFPPSVGDSEEYLKWFIRLLQLGGPYSVQYHPTSNDLTIPCGKVTNLRRNLFLYLLKYLSQLGVGNHHLFAVTEGPLAPRVVVGTVYVGSNGVALYSSVMDVFANIVRMFRDYFDDQRDEDDYWKDTDSGEVIVLRRGADVRFRLTQVPGFVFPIGAFWVDELIPIFDSGFPEGGIISIKNYSDNLCLVYSIAMGLAKIGWPSFFPRGMRYVDLNWFATKLNSCTVSDWGIDEAKRLMVAVRQRIPGDVFTRIDNDTLHQYSTSEVCDRLRAIETELVPQGAALDVYMLRVSLKGKKRIFPCYMSDRRDVPDERRIKLVNVTFANVNHFCLVSSLRKVFSGCGGKIFETCQRCHRTFYSRAMCMKHRCEDGRHPSFAWSNVDADDDDPLSAGICMKCHLRFKNAFDLEYHQKHCFMKNRSGSRYVKLSDEPFLRGKDEEDDPEVSREEALGRRKLFFADFESSIDGEGHHATMSYGLYDTVDGEYFSGYSLEEFMEKVIEFSKRHKEIHVYFHNAMNYDANFILRYVLREKKDWSINVIMKSASRLQTIKFIWMDGKTQRRIRIGDTYHFMTMSLDRIVSSIRKDDIEENRQHFSRFFEEFRKKYPELDDVAFDKVLHKNLFPYRFFDDPAKLDTDIGEFDRIFRPAEENLQFFSEAVSVEDLAANYPKFEEICELFNVRTARDYHDIYLLCDVMEIADVFLRARESLYETHHIDIARYIGMPGASWAAFLKYNPAMQLPLYRATKFAEFFNSMTRGGVTSAPLRYACSDATHSIIYLDVNGLYPFVMQKYLYPCGELEWRTFDESVNQDPQKYFMDVLCPSLKEYTRGCCVAADLHFPPEVKKMTDQFPFAPEHRVLKDCYFDENGEMYPFLQRWSEANDGERMKPFIGLVGTLEDKVEYGVHWRLLRWYIKHGVVLRKLYYGVFFDEGDYLRGYVQLNISIRNQRKDELGKMVYKLLGNSIYGKTFESPFNRGTYLIVRNEEKLTGLLEEGGISSITPIDEENCIVKLDAEQVVLDKPTYIGACVTEYAKLHMYKLFYDKLMGIFPGIELVYTDTDSFIVRVEHAANMGPKELFEFIDARCPGLFGSVGGQVKSETGGEDLIAEVIALRSKLYAYRTTKGKIGKRAKGTTSAAQERELSWDVYKKALFELRAVPTHNMQFLRSGFEVQTIDMVKQSISVNDGKRFICPDGIHTHAWGWKEDDNERSEEEEAPSASHCELL